MNDIRFNKFIEETTRISMNEYEKSDVLERTLAVIEHIDAISVKPISKTTGKIRSPWMSFISNLVERKFIPGFVAAVLLLGTGGVSLAAESALPGDSLYTLKLRVNEEVKSFVAITPESKAKFAVESAEKRLQEASLLSASGKLTDKNKTVLKKELTKQATNIKNRVAALVSQNKFDSAQEIALDFESSLKAHEIILNKISERSTLSLSSTVQIDEFLADIRTEIATTSESILVIQDKQASVSDIKLQTQDKYKSLKIKLTMIGYTKNHALAITPEASSTFETKIKDANSTFINAETLLKEEKYIEALAQLRAVEKLIIEAETVIEAEMLVGQDIVKVLLMSPIASSTASTTVNTSTEVASGTASSTIDANASANTQ